MRARSTASWRPVPVVLLVLGLATSPLAAEDGPGVIVCFERRGVGTDAASAADVDVQAELLSADGAKAWGSKAEGVPVARSPLLEGRPAVCSDGAGGAIVVYTREFTEGPTKGDVQICAERLAPDGKRLWIREGQSLVVSRLNGVERLPAVVSDGQGGAILAYVWTAPSGHRAILAQRLLPDGTRCWQPEKGGLVLAGARGLERPPVLVADGAGGAIVLFEWDKKDGNYDVWAQRVSPDGNTLWRGGEGPLPVASTAHVERNVTAVPDGAGGVIAVFELEFVEGKYAGDVDLAAQRLDADGKALWREGKAPVLVSSFGEVEANPAALPDGGGGALVVFEVRETEGENAGEIDIFALRLDGQGRLAWNEGKKASAVATSVHQERSPVAVASGDGGMIVGYEVGSREEGEVREVDVFAQRVGADGKLMWNAGRRSSPVFTKVHPERYPLAVADGGGGAIFVASAYVPDTETVKAPVVLVSQRLGIDGKLRWRDGKGVVPVAVTVGADLHAALVRAE